MKAARRQPSRDDDSVLAAPKWFTRREPLLAFLLGLAAMTWVQWGTYEPAGRDSFYHIKMAVLLPEIGFPEQFHWLRHTILNEHNVSHHHGLHIMLVPFVYGSKWLADLTPESWHEWAKRESENAEPSAFATALGSWLRSPYILGAKVFSVLLFGVVVLLADLIMRHLAVGFRWFWLLGILALPTDFYLRMAYIRAPIASLATLLLVYYSSVRGRYVWVGLLGITYCHLYGGFVFYPILVGLVALCYLICSRDWRRFASLLVACALGLVVGLLTHPYFPENISFLGVQIFETGLQTAAVEKVRVGSEWKPINLDYWIQISAFTLIVLVMSFALRLNCRRLCDPETLSLMVLNLFFLGLCLWARRFIEYWPMFCILSSAALWRGFDPRRSKIADAAAAASPDGEKVLRRAVARIYGTLCLIALVTAGFTLTMSRDAAKCKFDIWNIRKAMAFLRENTPQGSLIFADDWDEFPIYFYYNHHNDYVCGLDPQFTNSMDPTLWERFCVITQGRSPRTSIVKVRASSDSSGLRGIESETVRVDLADIKTHFAADYVLVDKGHQPFYRQLLGRPSLFTHVYPPFTGPDAASRVESLAVFRVASGPDGHLP